MSLPIQQLPVVQNWDCHVTGTCCKEYHVALSDAERKRIEEQNWDEEKDLGGHSPFEKIGTFRKRYFLNHREDGSCVFLNQDGRCQIHEKHGYEAKPLPCRLFPFVLVPVGDHWRVSLRFACPSAAANKGRGVVDHKKDLQTFAEQLAEREKLKPLKDRSLAPAPRMTPMANRRPWSDVLLFVDALLKILHRSQEPIQWRLRKCLALAQECKQAKLHRLESNQIPDLLTVLREHVASEVPQDPKKVDPPTWVGRVLFRQALAVFTRKDHGPKRGIARLGRMALLKAAWRFAKGSGNVPRLHDWLPMVTFEELEEPTGELSQQAQNILERYYSVKVSSVQFCGVAQFGFPFWEGFSMLALTYPMLMWVMRAFMKVGLSDVEGVTKALSIVDDHFGFNRVLKKARQRMSLRILASRGEIRQLVAWYSR